MKFLCNKHQYITLLAIAAVLFILVIVSPFILFADSRISRDSKCSTPNDRDCDGVINIESSCGISQCTAFDLDDNDPSVGTFLDEVNKNGIDWALPSK